MLMFGPVRGDRGPLERGQAAEVSSRCPLVDQSRSLSVDNRVLTARDLPARPCRPLGLLRAEEEEDGRAVTPCRHLRAGRPPHAEIVGVAAGGRHHTAPITEAAGRLREEPAALPGTGPIRCPHCRVSCS